MEFDSSHIYYFHVLLFIRNLTLQNVVIVNKTIIKIYIGQLHNYYALVSFGNSAESD